MQLRTIIVLLVFLVLISGCASLDAPNSARDQAGFYYSNYPKVSSNDKAQMLMQQFDTDRTPYTAKKKTYKVECILIYDYKGHQVFPDKGKEPKGTVVKSEIIKNRGL